MKYRNYKKEEVEKFLEDEFIDFEDEKTDNAIIILAKRQEVILAVKELPDENGTKKEELIIKIKLSE